MSHLKPFMLTLLIVGTLFVSGTSLAEPELKGGVNELTHYLLDNRRIVVISGEGEEKASADNAIVSLMVKTKEDKLQQALSKNKKIRNTIRNELIKKGIKEKDISFAKFASTPDYGWFGDKPTSYTINNEIKITIKSENKLEAIASIVDSKKEVYFVRSVTEHTNKENAKRKAQDKALNNILAKKKLYQDKLGIKLSAIRVIDENIVTQQPAPVLKQRRAKSIALSEDLVSAPRAGNKSFGEITYRAYTRVEFKTGK